MWACDAFPLQNHFRPRLQWLGCDKLARAVQATQRRTSSQRYLRTTTHPQALKIPIRGRVKQITRTMGNRRGAQVRRSPRMGLRRTTEGKLRARRMMVQMVKRRTTQAARTSQRRQKARSRRSRTQSRSRVTSTTSRVSSLLRPCIPVLPWYPIAPH